MAIRIAINGAAGRMGQRLVSLASADAELKLVAALEHAAHSQLGADAGTLAGAGALGVQLSTTLVPPVDVVIDFSVPSATDAMLATCLEKKTPLVLATTGLEPAQQEAVRQ